MKMVTAHDGPRAVVRLTGRLDGESAEHLSDLLDDLLRDGMRVVHLDMSEVDYVSSAGTQVLARRYQDFSALRGELRVINPTSSAIEALTLAGIEDRLLVEASDAAQPAQPRLSAMMQRVSDVTRDSWRSPTGSAPNGEYEITTRETETRLSCRLVGDPDRLARSGFSGRDYQLVTFSEAVFGLGLGAIGRRVEDAEPRLGELIGLAGVVSYLPTDGARVPDYDIGTTTTPATAMLATGLVLEGGFSRLLRFHLQPETEAVPLSELAAVALDASGGAAVGMVIAAETAGLVGAGLRRPPSGTPLEFEVPEIREWLAFRPEPIFEEATVLIVGVAARQPDTLLAPFLRPLGGNLRASFSRGGVSGHFHAAAFPYRPLPQRSVSLPALVSRLFTAHKPRAVLHLLSDDRGAAGAGETQLLRGLCWAGPIEKLTGLPQ
jgi:anti-anti-sigma factor